MSKIYTLATWPFSAEIDPGAAYLSISGDLYDYPTGRRSERHLGLFNSGLDLSPLSHFMDKGAGREYVDESKSLTVTLPSDGYWTLYANLSRGNTAIARIPTGVTVGMLFVEEYGDRWSVTYERSDKGLCYSCGTWPKSEMYGWPVDSEDPEPKQVPEEKSPIDREIDKMMERRKAKREAPEPRDVGQEIADRVREERAGRVLRDAMSKIPNHISAIHSRGTPMCRGGW